MIDLLPYLDMYEVRNRGVIYSNQVTFHAFLDNWMNSVDVYPMLHSFRTIEQDIVHQIAEVIVDDGFLFSEAMWQDF